ncbi:hypothetical protein OAP20_04820 [Alphaproteobacteria bacterium]|nr:hypothetical protein [Alphaproteobacteria bacterium]
MSNNLDYKNNFKQGLEYLSNKNEIFSSVVKQVGSISFNKRDLKFESLIKIIINQQLSNNVANVIFLRLKKLNLNKEVTPAFISKIDFEKIRNQGVSNSKATFMKDLSRDFLKNPKIINKWKQLDDENAFLEIQKHNGFGPWSANIILLFYMSRPNIFPFGDSTLKKAYQNIYNKNLNKDLKELNWAEPHRSIVALYFWRWVDNGMIKFKLEN